jgi:hypothetical protein
VREEEEESEREEVNRHAYDINHTLQGHTGGYSLMAFRIFWYPRYIEVSMFSTLSFMSV